MTPKKEKTEIITLCGSMRHLIEILDVYKRESIKGKIVLLPVFDCERFKPHRRDINTMCSFDDTVQCADLTKLQQEKILMSDYVLVVNPNGYHGANTQKEIHFAKENNISVFYENEPINLD